MKYYALMVLVVGIALFYAFVKDPCNQQLRTDFANRYPDYRIQNSRASEGSPESVRCRISYQMTDSEQIHEDIWLYQHSRSGWEFSRILETSKTEQTNGVFDESPRPGSEETSASGAPPRRSIVNS